MTNSPEQQSKKAEQEVDPRVDLAVERTELAWERTQLAWLRTTLTLLASGIGLDKGVEAIRSARIESGDALFDNAHIIGIILSVAATLLFTVNTVIYFSRIRKLARMKGGQAFPLPTAVLASILVVLAGIGVSFLLLVS